MPELKMISPLLDHLAVEREAGEHNGRSCFILRNPASERFVLKRMSVPASDSQIRALILSGAYPSEEAVHEYYTRVVTDIRQELDKGRELAASGHYAGALDYQIEPKDTGVGYDVYILYPLYISLSDFLTKSSITNLRAVNLGIDICDALSACREAGYLFANIKPENIYLMPTGKFLLGDLGLAAVEDLRYTCIPEEYIGPYSAPELSDFTLSPNTTIDLYSLGMVLYRIYNGNHGPFMDENTGEAMADKLRLTGKPLPSPIYADYEMAGIILKACAFKKENRYHTPEEFKQALTLYMQRNEVSDTPVVPPIVASEEPLVDPDAVEEEQEEPIRMTEVEALDDDFRRSFAPDLSGAGTADDIDPTAAVAAEKPAEKPVPAAPETQSEEEQPQEQSENAEQTEQPAEEAVPADDVDPDQMDLDALLASVNEVVGTADAEEGDASAEDASEDASEPPAADAPAEPSHDYVDDESDEGEEQETKKKSRWLPVAVIVALLAAIGAVVYFLINWYFVDMTQLNVISCETEQLVVKLVSTDDPTRFVLNCTDSYGNAYPGVRSGNRYTFSGLSEKTTYTVAVSAAQYHKLLNADSYAVNVTTPESTVISDFRGVRGDEDGEVQLSFRFDGPAPTQWQLTCSNADGTVSNVYSFVGSSYIVSGLSPNEVYTFTLDGAEGIYLSGETTTEYEILPIVEAKNLTVSEISGKQVTLSWEQGENSPAQWEILCEAEGIDPITATATECTCTLELPDFDREYTFTLSAKGMDLIPKLTLPADPIIVDSLTATADSDGSVTVSWNAPAGKPDGGWYISYNTVGSLHAAYMSGGENSVVTGTSATLTGLIPDAEYEIKLSLTAADASSAVFGQSSVTVKTPVSEAFTDYGVTPEPPYPADSSLVSLWAEPTKTDWTYYDLNDHRNSFSAEEKIAVCIEVNAVNQSDDTVTLLYAVRDASGNVVNDVSQELVWDSLWYNRRHANAIPLPAGQGEASVAGNYTLEIYINGKLLASTGFTIA